MGSGPDQHHVDAHRDDAGGQRLLQHVAGQPGVLADDHPVAVVAVADEVRRARARAASPPRPSSGRRWRRRARRRCRTASATPRSLGPFIRTPSVGHLSPGSGCSPLYPARPGSNLLGRRSKQARPRLARSRSGPELAALGPPDRIRTPARRAPPPRRAPARSPRRPRRRSPPPSAAVATSRCCRRLAAGQLPEERLAAGAHQHRQPEHAQVGQPPQQEQVVAQPSCRSRCPGPPGCRSRGMPARSPARIAPGQARHHLVHHVLVAGALLHRLRACPGCASGSTAAPARRRRRGSSGSTAKPVMSFTSAGARLERLARPPRPSMVSIEMGTSGSARSSAANHRQHPRQLLLRLHRRRAPGRVDSPPTSSRSAPASASARPCATAASASRKRPPSEKLSGVTLTHAHDVGAVRRTRRCARRASSACGGCPASSARPIAAASGCAAWPRQLVEQAVELLPAARRAARCRAARRRPAPSGNSSLPGASDEPADRLQQLALGLVEAGEEQVRRGELRREVLAHLRGQPQAREGELQVALERRGDDPGEATPCWALGSPSSASRICRLFFFSSALGGATRAGAASRG